MKQFYENKRILITGASSGIGRDLAGLLAGFGAELALAARREEALKTVQAECRTAGRTPLVFPADVRDRQAMQAVTGELLRTWGAVDIVIANAGIGDLNPGDHFSLELNQKTMETNFFGMVNTLAPFIPSMIEKRSGHLVGMSSLAAFRGLPGGASYGASKAAQALFLESLRVDLKRYDIAVTTIHPGFIATPMTAPNKFKMPFLLTVRQSSLLIAKAVMQRRTAYLYPWQTRLLTYGNRLLPNCIYDPMILLLSGKKGRKKRT